MQYQTQDQPMFQTFSTNDDDWEWIVECPFDPPHKHRFPSDWIFGGPNDNDFRADPRWKPSVYTYFDDKLNILHITSAPWCDDEAIDAFTKVAKWFPHRRPTWIQVRRPGEVKPVTLPVKYDPNTDEVTDL